VTELTAITMPKWGLMMEEGKVTAWLAREGDAVEEGADIAEIETSKITNVMESPASGSLLRIVCEPDISVPVGQLLAVMGPTDADAAAVDAFIDTFEPMAGGDDGQVARGPTVGAVDTALGAMTYAETGEGEPPLVLIHGFGGDRNNWLFNVDAWARDRRVVSLDLPGHGGSTKAVGAGDVKALAGAVSQMLDPLGLERSILVGHSLGAGVALQLALDRPDKVAGVVAISGLGFGGDVSPEFLEGFISAERRKDLLAAVEMLFADPGLASRELIDQLLAYKRTDGVQAALEAIAGQALAPGAAAGLARSLPQLSVPVLALHGDADRVVAPPVSLPAAIESKVIPGVGHMPHMEAAGQVTAAVSEFAARLS
jgi:pyruvate dehydrogenase E2 component (dihydrolipoamide acetyltransferase)